MRHGQLRAFHAVASEGGFSSAAKALGLSQPSVSDHVRKLEQVYDVLLFSRRDRQVMLSPAGRALYQLTQEYFEAEDRIVAQLSKERASIAGILRVLVDSALHIAPALNRFRQRHPKVFVSIRTGNTEDILASIRNYEAEIGVVGNRQNSRDLDVVELGTSPIVAISKKGYLESNPLSLSLSQIADHPLVFRETGSKTRDHVQHAASTLGIRLKPAIEVEGREALREVVASGMGVGFISEAELGHDERLQKISIAGANIDMSESLVTLAARSDVPVIRAFLRTLESVQTLRISDF